MISETKQKLGYFFDQLSKENQDSAVHNFVMNFMSELDGMTLQLFMRREKDFHEPHEYNYNLLRLWIRRLIYERNGKFLRNGDIIYMETSPRIYMNHDLSKNEIEGPISTATERMSGDNIRFFQNIMDKKDEFSIDKDILASFDNDILDTKKSDGMLNDSDFPTKIDCEHCVNHAIVKNAAGTDMEFCAKFCCGLPKNTEEYMHGCRGFHEAK